MAKAEDLYKKWKNDCPPKVDVGDFRKFVEYYLGPWLREKKGSGSHLLIVEHPALSIAPSFGGNSTLSIAVESGRVVKGVYVKHALKAIECIEMYERHVGGKGDKTLKTGTLEYYMALDYPVEIRGIPEDLGGGYSASIPSLGRWAFYADGETVTEALGRLEGVKATMFQDMLERGKAIAPPPPVPEEAEDVYGGRILLRVPKELHRDAARRAEKNGCSLNHYISTVLAHHVGGAQWVEDSVAKALQVFTRPTVEQQGQRSFKIEPAQQPSPKRFAGKVEQFSVERYGRAA